MSEFVKQFRPGFQVGGTQIKLETLLIHLTHKYGVFYRGQKVQNLDSKFWTRSLSCRRRFELQQLIGNRK